MTKAYILVCVPEITLLREELLESQPVSASPRPGAHWALQDLMLLQFRVHYLDMWSAERDMSWADSLTCLGTHQPLVGAFICYWIRSELLPLCRVGHCQRSEKAHLEMLMRVQNHRMVEVQQKMQIPARRTGQPLHQYCLGLNGWRAIFQKGPGGQHAGGTWALSVPLQQVRQLHIGQHPWEWKHHVKEEIFPFN